MYMYMYMYMHNYITSLSESCDHYMSCTLVSQDIIEPSPQNFLCEPLILIY